MAGDAAAVLVTGASTGIGEACVKRLAGRFHVFAGVRKRADADRWRESHGGSVTPVMLDVTDNDAIGKVAALLDDRLGEAGLAGLVNNAGIAVGGPLEFLPLDELRRQLEVNVVGQVALTQALLPLIRRGASHAGTRGSRAGRAVHAGSTAGVPRNGRIVFIGSVSGISALPFTGAYAASKHALEAIADAWRVELRPFGIDIAMVEPGAITTPIWNTSLAAADRTAGEMPPEFEEYYGRLTRGVRRRAERASSGATGNPPDAVARVVEHALIAPRPRTRYVVGRDARLRVAMKRLLPDRWLDAAVVRTLERLAGPRASR
jgi:NAD(P)-dependent dehydrogenase (short-subunit alcohol dehydrogenase family)